jgi:hypothetical protein
MASYLGFSENSEESGSDEEEFCFNNGFKKPADQPTNHPTQDSVPTQFPNQINKSNTPSTFYFQKNLILF